MKWFKVHLAVIGYAVLMIGGVLGFHVIEKNDYKSCQRGNGVRIEIRALIILSYNQGSILNFTKVPGFDELDGKTKTYFVNLQDVLEQASSKDNRQQRVNEALSKVPVVKCSKPWFV